jgi:MFS family permease
MVNFDSGGTAAVLVQLSWGCADAKDRPPDQEYDPGYPCLDQVWKGYLGSVPYVGLVFGCPVVGALMARFREQPLLASFIAMNSVATFLFAFQTDKYCLVSAKFVIGFTQAAVSIYGPVWVSSFAPPSTRTLWFGLMQSAAAIGNLIGYAVCGYMVSAGVYYQWAFRLQASSLAILCVVLTLLPGHSLNASEVVEGAYGEIPSSNIEDRLASGGDFAAPAPQSLDSEGSLKRSPSSAIPTMARSMTIVPSLQSTHLFSGEQSRPTLRGRGRRVRDGCFAPLKPLKLLLLPMFSAQLFSQCALFFVVTAIQQWASEFFITEFHRDKTEVTTVFVFVSATAPILGVVIGSSVIDKVGTETAVEVAKACRITCIWGFIATIAGFLAGGIQPKPSSAEHDVRFYGVVACIWLQLFFGGAMLPASSAMGLRTVPVKARTTASSLSQLLCNIFGFALGSLVPGVVSASYGMRVAMQIAFAWASFGCLGTLVSYYVAISEVRQESVRTGPDTETASDSGSY